MNSTMTVLPRMHALILAGGRGERLQPLTAYRPKPLISFGGIFRIIDFTLSNCLNSALSRVSLLTQYRSEELHDYIRQNWAEVWRHSARCGTAPLPCLPPVSGKQYRGTADAVFQNLPILESDWPELVLILSGDHIYDMDYRDLIRRHAESNADLTIAAVEHPLKDAHHFGVVEVDGDMKVIGFQEKPPDPRPLPARPTCALISMGIYVFKTDVLVETLLEYCGVRRSYDFGHDIIPLFAGSGRMFAYNFRDERQSAPGYWRDVGTVDSYYEASMDLVRPQASFNPYIKDGCLRRVSSSKLGASMSGTAHISQSVLSPGVRIEEYAFIEDCILMPGVRVGREARLRRAIVEEGITIPAGFQAGLDAEHDRTHHTVSEAGVVVVCNTPSAETPTVVPFERTVSFHPSRATRKPVTRAST